MGNRGDCLHKVFMASASFSNHRCRRTGIRPNGRSVQAPMTGPIDGPWEDGRTGHQQDPTIGGIALRYLLSLPYRDPDIAPAVVRVWLYFRGTVGLLSRLVDNRHGRLGCHRSLHERVWLLCKIWTGAPACAIWLWATRTPGPAIWALSTTGTLSGPTGLFATTAHPGPDLGQDLHRFILPETCLYEMWWPSGPSDQEMRFLRSQELVTGCQVEIFDVPIWSSTFSGLRTIICIERRCKRSSAPV
jgi:hypothetical protein